MSVIYDSREYRIEEHPALPKRSSVDFKDRSRGHGVALVNIGWRDSRNEAFDLIGQHHKTRPVKVIVYKEGDCFYAMALERGNVFYSMLCFDFSKTKNQVLQTCREVYPHAQIISE